jgi:hypothetical protein
VNVSMWPELRHLDIAAVRRASVPQPTSRLATQNIHKSAPAPKYSAEVEMGDVEHEPMPTRKICTDYMNEKSRRGGGPGQMCMKGGGYHPRPHERDALLRQGTLQSAFMGI